MVNNKNAGAQNSRSPTRREREYRCAARRIVRERNIPLISLGNPLFNENIFNDLSNNIFFKHSVGSARGIGRSRRKNNAALFFALTEKNLRLENNRPRHPCPAWRASFAPENRTGNRNTVTREKFFAFVFV